MNFFYATIVVLLLILSSTTAIQNKKSIWMKDKPSKVLSDLEDKLLAELKSQNPRRESVASGPAVDWKWTSWLIGGPTCHDPSRYKLDDLSSDTAAYLQQVADAVLSGLYKDLQMQFPDGIGLGLGFTYKGKKIYSNFAGTTGIGSSTEPNEDTIISVGSVTKMFTSMLLNKFVDQGFMDPSDPVSKYFNDNNAPAFHPINPYDSVHGADAVTMESLAGQSSGLPRDPSCVNLGFENCTEELAITGANNVPLFHQPLTRPHYSNLGFSILGHSCERAAKNHFGQYTSYEDLIELNILSPFGMESSGFNYTDDVLKRMATGYTVDNNGSLVVSPQFAQSLCWTNPAGGMYSSMKDMLSYVSHLSVKDGVLSLHGYEQYFLPGVDLRDGVSSYGKYGWETIYANGLRTLTKSGLMGGFSSEVVIIPELEIGAFAWANVQSGVLPSFLALKTLNAFIPKLISQFESKQSQYTIPDGINDYIGSYFIQGTSYLTFERTKQTESTGVFSGTVFGSNVVYTFDDKISEGMNFFAFRVHSVHVENQDSCFIDTASGVDDDMVFFQTNPAHTKFYATLADMRLYAAERGDRPPPKSSSSASAASILVVSSFRVLLLSVFVGIGVMLRRPASIIAILGAVTLLAYGADAFDVEDHFKQYNSMRDQEKFFKNMMENLGERGPAVNWTWDSVFSGPTCVDKTNFTLRDIPDSVFEPAYQFAHSFMEQIASYGSAVGFGLVYNGKVIHTHFSGKISETSDVKPDEDTVLQIGSITKIFTSLMMASLADKNALKVSDPVTKYFNSVDTPEFTAENPFDKVKGVNAVTLESLSSQTSGLARECICEFDELCTEQVSLTYLSALPLYHQPLTRPHYSNAGFSLLGHCCERAARKFYNNNTLKFEEWLEDNVFSQWNMTSTGFDFPDNIVARMATGYSYDSVTKKLVVNPLFAKSIYWSNPCGGMYSTTSDMMKFAIHVLDKDGVLSPSSFEQYLFPGAILSDGVSSYGKCGWEVVFANGLRTVTKSGLIGGFSTTLTLVPDLKLGLFFWTNFDATMTYISAQTTNMVVPLILSALPDTNQTKPIPDVINDILGEYELGGHVIINITADNLSSETGVFYGSIAGVNVWYEYDKKTTKAFNKESSYFFRFFTIADKESGMDGCFALTMGGIDDSLLMFQNTGGEWTATYFDSALTVSKVKS